jgi:hypothetical protein
MQDCTAYNRKASGFPFNADQADERDMENPPKRYDPPRVDLEDTQSFREVSMANRKRLFSRLVMLSSPAALAASTSPAAERNPLELASEETPN